MSIRETLRRLNREGRLVRYGLIVSVAFNLLFVGLVIGALLATDGRGPSRSWHASGLPIRPLIDALPDSQKADLRERFRALSRAKGGRSDGLIRENVEMLAAAIEAEPYQEAAVIAAFSSQRKTFGALGAEGHAALVAVISGLSLAERGDLARKFRENALSKRRHRSDRDPGDKQPGDG